MTEALKDTPEKIPEEKNSELIDAFLCYDWIILHTNPIYTEIDLSFTIEPVPSCIRKDVDRYKQKEWLLDKSKTPRDILFLQSINLLLSELVKKGIPLYKVDNKEITCVEDIKRLWQETGLNKDYYPFITTPSYTHQVLQARLAPQRLEILKKLKAEKQDIAQNKSAQNTFRLKGHVWEETTIVKKFINWLQNQRILAILVIVCLVIISVASFTDSIDKLVTFTKKYFHVPSTSKVIPDVSGSQNSNSPASSSNSIKREVQPKLDK